MKTIVSKEAHQYFQLNNITSQEWITFCRDKFNLKINDIVFYEGNTIGYICNKC